MFRQPLLSFSERLSTRCRCSRQWAIIGPLVSVHRPVFFFPDVYHFPDLSVHPVSFSVDHLGVVPVYDVVQRDGVVCVLLCCGRFTGASCVCTHITLCDFLLVFLKMYTQSSACFSNVSFVTVFTRYFIHRCLVCAVVVLPSAMFTIITQYVCQCFSTFLLPQNPKQAWRSLTEPHALIRESNDVCEVEATGCLQTHFPSRANPLWGRQSKQRWPILKLTTLTGSSMLLYLT